MGHSRIIKIKNGRFGAFIQLIMVAGASNMASSSSSSSSSPSQRAILVTDIPYITEKPDQLKDKLELYFGKAKHGGGEITKVICPIAGSLAKAIIVFESEEGKLVC